MRVYKIGYWHSSSDFCDAGYVLFSNKKEALKYTQEIADGLGWCVAKHIKSIYKLAPPKVIDFLLKKKT